jgi:hypothetical protein
MDDLSQLLHWVSTHHNMYPVCKCDVDDASFPAHVVLENHFAALYHAVPSRLHDALYKDPKSHSTEDMDLAFGTQLCRMWRRMLEETKLPEGSVSFFLPFQRMLSALWKVFPALEACIAPDAGFLFKGVLQCRALCREVHAGQWERNPLSVKQLVAMYETQQPMHKSYELDSFAIERLERLAKLTAAKTATVTSSTSSPTSSNSSGYGSSEASTNTHHSSVSSATSSSSCGAASSASTTSTVSDVSGPTTHPVTDESLLAHQAFLQMEAQQKNERARRMRERVLEDYAKRQAAYLADLEAVTVDESLCVVCHEANTSSLCALSLVHPSVHDGGAVVYTCDHLVHTECFDRYFNGLLRASFSRSTYRGARFLSLERGEFLCPCCGRLMNCLLPIDTATIAHHHALQPSSVSPRHIPYAFNLFIFIILLFLCVGH